MTTLNALGICLGIFIVWPGVWVFVAWQIWRRKIHFRRPWVSGGEIPHNSGSRFTFRGKNKEVPFDQ